MMKPIPTMLMTLVLLPYAVWADDVPLVDSDPELLVRNVKAIQHAVKEASGSLPQGVQAAIQSKDVLQVQQAIDPFVLAVVTINPESRVKVMRGPADVKYDTGWPAPFLVKVINEGGVTARLNVQSAADPLCKVHWYEDGITIPGRSLITNKLTGQLVEYHLLLVHCAAKGKREVILSFDVGQSTQDLGFRAELPVLLSPSTLQRARINHSDKVNLLQRLHGTTPNSAGWEKQRHCILENFQTVTGTIRDADKKPTDVRIESEAVTGKTIRRKLSWLSIDGDRVPGYVLLPANRSGKLPAILCLHQTTKIGKDEPAGLGGLANLHYAKELAERGYVTLVPDYPGFGENRSNAYQLGYASTTAKGIVNHQEAIDVLASMDEVDANRIGCIGHSLGGHNTLFVGLFDTRIKALASSCGFCSFPKYYHGNLKGWSHLGYMPRIASVYQCDPKLMPFDFTELLAILAPRPVFINAPLRDSNFDVNGVKDCVKAALPVYGLFGKQDSLVVEHPDCAHDFPTDVRERCYQFFDRHLK